MRNAIIALGLAYGLASGSALAGDSLQFGPAPDWVKPMAISQATSREGAVRPYATLSQSAQVRFTDKGDFAYAENAIRVQTPAGLIVGQPTVEWDPAYQTLTIHKANLIRDGQVIDLLKRGQSFIVIRREQELGKSILDGNLTAVLQVDGLQVGDIVDFAATLETRIDVLSGHSEQRWEGLTARYAGNSEVRALWSNDKPMHWRTSDDMPVPTVTKGATETELTLNLDGYRWPALVPDAPARFNRYGALQFSQFDSWNQVSAQMAPYYDRAETLGETSPLRAEVTRIRSLSNDPKVQAAAALKLVEDAVRYAANEAQTGGFTPPSADMTWLRRWGDCKAKSVLLVALLHQLGIQADPILVDTNYGDGMDSLLPAMALFNHVIVRAVIGGKTYWLDATGQGDGAIDTIDIPDYHWYLPLTAKGEPLQALPLPPLDRPETETVMRIDASSGIKSPAPAHFEFIQRGDAAAQTRLTFASLLPEAQDKKMRTYWKNAYSWVRPDSVSARFDPDSGEMRYIMDGTAELDWDDDNDGPAYTPDDSWVFNTYFHLAERDKGPHDQAPVAIDYPVYTRISQTIVLPNGGAAFSLVGDPVDTTVAGIAIKRRLSLKDGIFTFEAEDRTVAPEAPLAEAKTVRDALKAINKVPRYLQAPNMVDAPKTGAAVATGSPAAAEAGNARSSRPVVEPAPRPAPQDDAKPLTLHDVAEIYAGRKLP